MDVTHVHLHMRPYAHNMYVYTFIHTHMYSVNILDQAVYGVHLDKLSTWRYIDMHSLFTAGFALAILYF